MFFKKLCNSLAFLHSLGGFVLRVFILFFLYYFFKNLVLGIDFTSVLAFAQFWLVCCMIVYMVLRNSIGVVYASLLFIDCVFLYFINLIIIKFCPNLVKRLFFKKFNKVHMLYLDELYATTPELGFNKTEPLLFKLIHVLYYCVKLIALCFIVYLMIQLVLVAISALLFIDLSMLINENFFYRICMFVKLYIMYIELAIPLRKLKKYLFKRPKLFLILVVALISVEDKYIPRTLGEFLQLLLFIPVALFNAITAPRNIIVLIIIYLLFCFML